VEAVVLVGVTVVQQAVVVAVVLVELMVL
jgi:hypothetical protein